VTLDPEFKQTHEWTRLQLALARHASLGRARLPEGPDPRDLPLTDLDYMVLVAIAAADGKAFPHLNQAQIKRLLHENSTSGVSTSTTRLVQKQLCKELDGDERLALKLRVDARSKYYQVTDAGIFALLQYESVRFALPDAVANAIRPLPEYTAVFRELAGSIVKVLAQEFAEAGSIKS